MTRFATVVFDVDSTISGVEGVNWLAARRGPELARRIEALTDGAMRGEIPLERVYGERLAAIRPRQDDVAALSRAYVEAIAPGCAECMMRLRRAGVHLVVASGGLRPALIALARQLAIDLIDLHAVDVQFDAIGAYVGYNAESPLTTSSGKASIIEQLGLARPSLMVGDGVTDLAARPAVDAFAAFTGFVTRAPVVREADFVLDSFSALATLVLDHPSPATP